MQELKQKHINSSRIQYWDYHFPFPFHTVPTYLLKCLNGIPLFMCMCTSKYMCIVLHDFVLLHRQWLEIKLLSNMLDMLLTLQKREKRGYVHATMTSIYKLYHKTEFRTVEPKPCRTCRNSNDVVRWLVSSISLKNGAITGISAFIWEHVSLRALTKLLGYGF